MFQSNNPYLRLEVTIYPALSQHAALSEALEGTRDVPMNANQYVVGILRRELVNTGTDSPVCEGC
jgi:hypothetical protein